MLANNRNTVSMISLQKKSDQHPPFEFPPTCINKDVFERKEVSANLRNGDLLRLVLLGLRNDNAKNAILHRSLDGILINTNREAEAALEFTD